MKHRLLLLSALVLVAILLAAGGKMIAVEGGPNSHAIASAVCTSDPDQDVLAFSNQDASMEPVTSCAGGCPFLGDCDETGACTCPHGPGHCVVCGPQGQSVKCVKD
jgi:hypothetical protein